MSRASAIQARLAGRSGTASEELKGHQGPSASARAPTTSPRGTSSSAAAAARRPSGRRGATRAARGGPASHRRRRSTSTPAPCGASHGSSAAAATAGRSGAWRRGSGAAAAAARSSSAATSAAASTARLISRRCAPRCAWTPPTCRAGRRGLRGRAEGARFSKSSRFEKVEPRGALGVLTRLERRVEVLGSEQPAPYRRGQRPRDAPRARCRTTHRWHRSLNALAPQQDGGRTRNDAAGRSACARARAKFLYLPARRARGQAAPRRLLRRRHDRSDHC